MSQQTELERAKLLLTEALIWIYSGSKLNKEINAFLKETSQDTQRGAMDGGKVRVVR